MAEASKWKEAIVGEGYDLSFLVEMGSRMDVRLELWKYVQVASNSISEWKRMTLNKFNARKALDKLTECLAATGQLRQAVPQGDKVVRHLYDILADFHSVVPILYKLENSALKPRHWRAILVFMGQMYKSEYKYTVQELCSYDLKKYEKQIDDIYEKALKEFHVENRLNKVLDLWIDRKFLLAKTIPKSENDRVRTPSVKHKKSNLEQYREALQSTTTLSKRKLKINYDELFMLSSLEDLRFLLEDGKLQLQCMLESGNLCDNEKKARDFYNDLLYVDEILELWQKVQDKVNNFVIFYCLL